MSELPQKVADQIRRRARVLTILDAAERAAITPLPSAKLHAFAYLADVLSPVWGLLPFRGQIYKEDNHPHYPDLQIELDDLVILGLVEISDLTFIDHGATGARITGLYALNFASEYLRPLLTAMGCEDPRDAIDPADAEFHAFAVELANALATLADDQIDKAASADVTFSAPQALNNIVDFGSNWTTDRWNANASWRTAERFETFLPQNAHLSPGEKLFLYATYLGRAMNAA